MKVRFFTSVFIFLLFFFVTNHRRLDNSLFSSGYAVCWSLMLISNLGFSGNIQHITRILCLIIAWLYIVFKNKTSIKYKRKTRIGQIILIYILFCLISTMWSVSKLQTIVKTIELFTDLILIWLFFSKNSYEENVYRLLETTITVFGILLFVTVLGFFVWPDRFSNNGIMASRSLLGKRLGEGILGANKTSALAAIYISWFLLLKQKRNIYDYFFAIISIIAMFYSQSRASLALIPVILFFKFFKPKDKYKGLYFVVSIIIFYFVSSHIDVIYKYLLRGQTEELLLSGTGRLDVWRASIPYIAKRPIIGYGFGSGGEIVSKNLFGLATMHSGIFETLLGTGAIGLLLLLFQYGIALFKVINNIAKYGVKNNLFDGFVLLIYLIRTLTSLGIGNWHSPELMLWYCFLFSLEKRKSVQMIFDALERTANGKRYKQAKKNSYIYS